jgi:aminopeptidase N
VTREFLSSWQMYDRHLYPGGACRLHMLRRLLGDGPFFEGTADYLRLYSGKVVETDDFRRVLEDRSGRALGAFFDQWFHTAGYPDVRMTFDYDAERGEGTFRMEQAQVGAKGEGPLFELDTAVGWVLDGRLLTWPVRLTQAVQSVTVALPADPEQLRFDPYTQVLAKLTFNPGDKRLRRQLTHAGDVIGRILSGRELAKTGTRANIHAIRDAYRQESFWGVRVELARALGDSGSQAAVESLAELVGWEQDDRVLEPLLRAIGKFRDPVVAPAVSARLDRGLPYRASAAACEALGAQREQAPFEYLAQLAAIPSPYGIVQSGALRALAATRRAEALPLLEARVGYGNTSNRARPAAVSALATLAGTLDKTRREPVVDLLSDLLRDPIPRVRHAALAGLKTLRATEAIPAIEAYGAPLAVQEKLRADEAIAAIRKSEGDAIPALEKQVDELRDKLRKLEDSVAKLNGQAKSAPSKGAPGGKKSGKKKDKKG